MSTRVTCIRRVRSGCTSNTAQKAVHWIKARKLAPLHRVVSVRLVRNQEDLPVCKCQCTHHAVACTVSERLHPCLYNVALSSDTLFSHCATWPGVCLRCE